jgi:hypothetical protein
MAVADANGRKPLIPDVIGMTKKLVARLERSEEDKEAFAKLRVVLDDDDAADADLEYMLSLVRALRDVAGAGGARGLTRDELERLDRAISDEVAALARPALPRRRYALSRRHALGRRHRARGADRDLHDQL